MNPKKQKVKDRRRARKLAEEAWQAVDEGNLDLAEKIIRRAVEAQPDNPVLWADQGLILSQREKPLEAADAFRNAISLAPTEQIDMRRYDLVQQINTRGTFATSRACIPYLRKAPNPHVLSLSPPLDLQPKWFAGHLAYSLSKYGMSLCMLGLAEEYRAAGIACNALWPRTTIATAAVEFALGGPEMLRRSRKPEIVADAAHAILNRPARECTGQFFIDDSVLYEAGVRDFGVYSVEPGGTLLADLFIDRSASAPPGVTLEFLR